MNKEAVKDHAYAFMTEVIIISVLSAIVGAVGYGLGETIGDGAGKTWAVYGGAAALLGLSYVAYRAGHDILLIDNRWWDKEFNS